MKFRHAVVQGMRNAVYLCAEMFAGKLELLVEQHLTATIAQSCFIDNWRGLDISLQSLLVTPHLPFISFLKCICKVSYVHISISMN